MRDYGLPRNFNIKGLSLIDVTSEDDCLINSHLLDHIADGKIEEGERRGNGRQKLHKSMTWDSCFFDTAAFLEPEEFSNQEDVNRSRVSLTMLPSETLRQEDFKADFDEDIRASIQKSKRVPDNAGPSVKMELETKDFRIVSSSKKLENSNHDKVKQKASPKKPNTPTKEPAKTMKQVPSRSQTSQSVGRSGVSTSLHKPSKLMDRRDSLGAKDVKVEKDAKGRRTTMSKTSALDGSRNVVPRTTLSSRSSLSSSMICNSSMDMFKQNKDSSLVNSSPSGYTSTNASKTAAECKSQAGRSVISTLLKSPIKLHSSMSVAGSYGEWSVSSLSSPTSTANKRLNAVRASLGSGSSSHKGLVTDSDSQQVSDFQSRRHTRHSSLGGGAEDTASLDESENKVLDGSIGFHPAEIKRSILQPPSLKPPSSNGLRSRHTRTLSVGALTTGMPKTGAKSTNPSGDSNKAPPRTLQQSTSAAIKVRNASRNPKISPVMPPKLRNKPSQKTVRESY